MSELTEKMVNNNYKEMNRNLRIKRTVTPSNPCKCETSWIIYVKNQVYGVICDSDENNTKDMQPIKELMNETINKLKKLI